MNEDGYPIVHSAAILQITPAPGPLADQYDNVYAGYALCEFDLEWPNGERATAREILPFLTDGSIVGAPGESFYKLHAFGDDRPPFADFRAAA